MTPERWQQVKRVLDGALLESIDTRASYVADACANDHELQREVELLLASHEQAAPDFLEKPIARLSVPTPAAASVVATRTGRRIGAYDVLEPLGRGGMGEVYRAVRADGQFTKEVALKLVRTGLDSPFAVERFRNERQILAGLDHPNIARLLDGGTTDEGVPYLVMELVDGVAIDACCDARALQVRDRVALFLRVCGAVQYAHRRLVVHRDIKPGNILVTRDGIPKLLDFGIAKILDASLGADLTLARPMTLEYASPEQIRGEAIATAADVYALGVVLYRLLTGRSPYRVDARSPHDLSIAITAIEPLLPSLAAASPAVSRQLAGDLDNILGMALRKEPERRYQSVEQLADDLEHHLNGRPVSAVPDSWRYRAGKFVRRHRIALGVAAALLLVIVGGAGAAVYEARRALREEAVARQRFDMVRHLANAVVFEFNDALQNVPGTTAARKLIVARAVEYLDNLTQQEAADVSLARELAAAYTRIGDVLGNPYRPNLGDSAGALTSYRRAVDLFERLERRDPSADTRQGHADAYIGLGSLLWSNGDAEGARSNFRRALTIYEDLLRVEPRFLRNTAAVAYYLGQTELRFGDARQASLYYTRAQHDLESWLASNADDFVAKRTLALTFMKLADVAHLLGDDDDAAENYRQASKALDAMLAAQSSSLDIQRLAATAWLRLADLDGAVPSAEREAFARRAARVLQPLADSDPSNAQAVGDWASAERVLAASLADERRDAEAEAAYGIAVNAFERVLSTNPGYIETRRELGELYYHRGVLALRRSGPRASLEQFTHARALLEAPDVEHQVPRVLADLYALTGDAYEAIARQGERAAESTAIDWYKKSDAKWTAMAGQQRLSHNDAQRQEEVTHKLASASGRMPPPATK